MHMSISKLTAFTIMRMKMKRNLKPRSSFGDFLFKASVAVKVAAVLWWLTVIFNVFCG